MRLRAEKKSLLVGTNPINGQVTTVIRSSKNLVKPRMILKGVHGNGLGNLPGQWNKKWSEFIKTNPNASPSEIFNQAEQMLKQYGLEHLPYVPYKK